MASTGLLYRVLSLSTLDYRNPASYDLAEHILEEAASMRGASSEV